MPPGFHLLIAAQFTSALADNALLVVAMALLHEQGWAAWWAPLLKFSLTVAYVVLAPFVGPLADAVPKVRLMAVANGIKTLGVLALFIGVHPVWAFAVVGLGAAAYAPAKYGLVTETVPPRDLVAANGWIEVSIVCAVLLGTVCGGFLVSELLRESAFSQACSAWAQEAGLPLVTRLAGSLLVVLAVYGLAAALQLGVRDPGVAYPPGARRLRAMVLEFRRGNRLLWRDPQGGLSLAVTTLFWGVGATLQFGVLRWALDRLGLPLEQAAYLQAVVAVGVVLGAAGAGRWVPLSQAHRVLPAGVLLGALVAGVALVDSLLWAAPLLALVGVVGGILVVPMNALLQHRGHQLLTAGRSIAVQGYNENLSILVMLGVYSALLALEVAIVPLMIGLGTGVALAMGVFIRRVSAGRAARLAGRLGPSPPL